ncbi:hypothetical protein BTA51_05795 [Hahella sp. CCB-MM4]|uniref:M48 family metalloprotease n=1 Tax=Hahella sp. (strain CCB-MM4) TaxID=1926491 RepID=UPI000B9C1AC6|nr:M48 family metalloprotease [Hahella sp. CCB-MM4]OZG74512.1 hypothetical protein BTA51_05795 [Hahella sp. CCB-MM4]
MRSASVKRLLLAGMVSTLLTACSSPSVKPMTDPGYKPDTDDMRLRITADKLSKRIENSRYLYKNPEIQNYLNQLAERLVGGLQVGDLKLDIQIIENPDYNAFALANGHIYIHTGLLSLVDTEAELAAVLAHEIGHVVHRDATRAADQRQNAANIYAGFSALPLINIFGGLHMAGSISGYSRDLERDADHYAVGQLDYAGYNLAEGAEIFAKLSNATQGTGENDTPYFFSTHPRMKERVESFRMLESSDSKAPAQKKDPLQSSPATLFHDVTKETLVTYIELGKSDRADSLLTRLKNIEGDTATLRYYEAKIAQLKGEDDRYQDLLTKALTLGDLPEVRRELGILNYKNKEWKSAYEHLTRYLEQSPEAKDRIFIEAYLREIKEHKDTE